MWEIYTIGGGGLLVDTFNAVAALTGSGFMITGLNIMLGLGLLWALLKQGMGGTLAETLKWWGTTVVIIQALLVPKVEVLIIDRLVPSNPGVSVANVPLGLGIVASLASRVGDRATEATETVFALPDEMQFQANGMLFGNGALAAMRQSRLLDGVAAANLREFMQQCVFYDLQLGRLSYTELVNAPDVWGYLTVDNSPSAARAMQYDHGTGTQEILTCQAAAVLLNPVMNAQADEGIRVLGLNLFPTKTTAEARAAVLASLPVAHEFLIGSSRAALDAVKQSMMINAFYNAITGNNASSGNMAALEALSQARADIQTDKSYKSIARMAEKWVPIFRVLCEMIFYGCFFLVIFLSMLPGMGLMILKNYFFAFAWLQSWAPLYAILHRAMMRSSAEWISPIGAIAFGDPALTIATDGSIGTIADDVAVLAGYLTMSIPFLSFFLVKGAAAIASQGAQVLSVGARAATEAAGEATTGNLSYGNTSLDNHSWQNLSGFRMQTSPYEDMSRFTRVGGDGITERMYAGGRSILDADSSNIGSSVDLDRALSGGLRSQAAKTTESARASELQASQVQSAALAKSIDFAYSQGARFSDTTALDRETEVGTAQAMSNARRTVDELADKHGISRTDAQKLTELAYNRAGVGAEGSAGLKIFGTGASVTASTELGSQREDTRSGEANRQRFLDDLKQYSESAEGRRDLNLVSRAATKLGSSSVDDHGKSLQESIRADLQRSESLSQTASAQYRQADSLTREAEAIDTKSVGARTSVVEPFLHDLRSRLGDTEARRLISSDDLQSKERLQQEAETFASRVASRYDVPMFKPEERAEIQNLRTQSPAALNDNYLSNGADIRATSGTATLYAAGQREVEEGYGNRGVGQVSPDALDKDIQGAKDKLDAFDRKAAETKLDMEGQQSSASDKFKEDAQSMLGGRLFTGKEYAPVSTEPPRPPDMPAPQVKRGR